MAMNEFEKQIAGITYGELHSEEIKTLQVNLGLRCNQHCTHCHHKSSPLRTERMEWETMRSVLQAATHLHCQSIDLTGGAPELNPHFRRFVMALCREGHQVQVRTNLTVLMEPEMEDIPDFFRDYQIQLVASLPCYLEENVRTQRGDGVYEKSIAAIKRLNHLGYGYEKDLPLNLVYNPGGPYLPPPQSVPEEDYRRQLGEHFGITFTRLFTITNMPLGRFRDDLSRLNQEGDYLQLLRKSFNPKTVMSLMCRHQLNVGWDGTLYDCDFNLALGLPVNHGAPDFIQSFKQGNELISRRIVSGDHCFACTAGCGSSCGGALYMRL